MCKQCAILYAIFYTFPTHLRPSRGPEHPDTLQSMDGLAATFFRLGRSKEQLNLYEECLEIRKRVLGQEHPDTLQSMDELAATYIAMGKYDEVIQTLKKALEKDPAVDMLWSQLAYMAKRNYDQVIKTYERRIDVNPANVRLQSGDIPDAIMHHNLCDNCTPPSSIQGYLHRCTSCNDYDLCNACFNKSPHPHPDHTFLIVPSERWISGRRIKEES